MNPHAEDLLAELARALIDEIAPAVSPKYEAAILWQVGMLLSAAAEDWDRAASRLREENRAMRRLFTQLLPSVEERRLAADLTAHIASDDDDIRVSILRATSERMRETLTQVHAFLELHDGAGSRDGIAAIWRELKESTVRRHVTLDVY